MSILSVRTQDIEEYSLLKSHSIHKILKKTNWIIIMVAAESVPTHEP